MVHLNLRHVLTIIDWAIREKRKLEYAVRTGSPGAIQKLHEYQVGEDSPPVDGEADPDTLRKIKVAEEIKDYLEQEISKATLSISLTSPINSITED